MFRNLFKLDKSRAPYLCDEDFKLAFKSKLKTLQVDLSCAQFFEGDKNYRSAALSFNAALCYIKGVSSMEEYYKRYGHKVQRLVLVNTGTMLSFPYESVLKFCQNNPVEVLDMQNMNYFGEDVALSLPEYFNGCWVSECKEVYQKLKLVLLPKAEILPKREGNNCFSLSKAVLNAAKYVRVSDGLMYFGIIDIPEYINIQGLAATYLNNVCCSKAIWSVDYLWLQKQICMKDMGEFLKNADVGSMLIDFAEFKNNSCGAIVGIHGWTVRCLEISGRMKCVKKGIFTDLNNLEFVKLHFGVQIVDDNAFEGFPKLKKVEFSESVEIKDTLNPEICDVI